MSKQENLNNAPRAHSRFVRGRNFRRLNGARKLVVLMTSLLVQGYSQEKALSNKTPALRKV